MRFGRRIDLPSTRQIRHELVMMAVHEEARIKEIEDAKTKLVPVPAPASPAG